MDKMPPAPGEAGKLSQEQKDKVVAWLGERVARPIVCSICHSETWRLGDHFIAPSLFLKEGGLILGGPSYPHVMLICQNCAHTIFFNAVAIGLFPPASQPQDEKASEAIKPSVEEKKDG